MFQVLPVVQQGEGQPFSARMSLHLRVDSLEQFSRHCFDAHRPFNSHSVREDWRKAVNILSGNLMPDREYDFLLLDDLAGKDGIVFSL